MNAERAYWQVVDMTSGEPVNNAQLYEDVSLAKYDAEWERCVNPDGVFKIRVAPNNNVPYFVASMLHDRFANETVMHHHLIGGTVRKIRSLRQMLSDVESGSAKPVHIYCDLWARVPYETTFEGGATVHARKLRGEAGKYYSNEPTNNSYYTPSSL
jgi:hypothetical protein